MENNNYDAIINQILNIIKRNIIGSNDEQILASFIQNYWTKAQIILNDMEEITDELVKSVLKDRDVISLAANTNTPGAKLLMDLLSKEVNDSTKKQEKEYTRALKNNSNPSIISDDEGLDISGFTNVIIIIVATIILGLVLAAIIMH